MKRDKAFTALWALLLGSSLSVGSVLCLATGFSLTVDNLPRLILLCCCAAFCAAIVFPFSRGGLFFALVSAFFCGYLWRLGTPERQLLALVQNIAETYNSAYQWGVPALSAFPQSADFPLMCLGYLIAASVCFWVCRGKGLSFAIAALLLPVLSCFVVTDTVPERLPLFLVMAGLAIMLLTADLRRKNPAQANRLAAMTVLPITAALALLFLLVPRNGYVNQSEALREKLLQWAQTIPARMESTVAGFAAMDAGYTSNVNLAALGSQHQSSAPVMTVTAPSTGTLYLRGQDYDCYTGTSWVSTADRAENFTLADGETMDVLIQTNHPQAFLYIPYYPAQALSLTGGMTSNREKALEYSIPAGSLSENREQDIAGKYGTLPDGQRYLSLPERTQAAHILEQILPDSTGSHSAKASAIAAFVRNCASYDLNPEQMPQEEEDFALWFLEDSDRGYCVHFATAAVVLLRSAQIPARYVTGYLTHTSAGKSVTVTEQDAHAWAEYYEPRLDAWLILEATPADSDDTNLPATEPEETVPATQTPPETTTAAPPEENTAPATEVMPTAPENPPEAAMDLTWLKQLSTALAFLGAGLLILKLQRSLRLALRRRKQTQGSVNSQALYRWREAEHLSRLLKQTPEEDLLALAQKAKFSQHDLTEEELGQFDGYLRSCLQLLRQKPWYIRLMHQYIYAAY